MSEKPFNFKRQCFYCGKTVELTFIGSKEDYELFLEELNYEPGDIHCNDCKKHYMRKLKCDHDDLMEEIDSYIGDD